MITSWEALTPKIRAELTAIFVKKRAAQKNYYTECVHKSQAPLMMTLATTPVDNLSSV